MSLLIWTKNLPDESGHYWMRDVNAYSEKDAKDRFGILERQIVEVVMLVMDDTQIGQIEYPFLVGYDWACYMRPLEFAGPIKEPIEPDDTVDLIRHIKETLLSLVGELDII